MEGEYLEMSKNDTNDIKIDDKVIINHKGKYTEVTVVDISRNSEMVKVQFDTVLLLKQKWIHNYNIYGIIR